MSTDVNILDYTASVGTAVTAEVSERWMRSIVC